MEHLATRVLLQPAPALPAESAPAPALDFLQVMLNAPASVKALVGLLLVMALVSWFVVGVKALRLGQAGRQSRRFLDLFWGQAQSGTWDTDRLEAVYGQLDAYRQSPVARVFHAGYVELARVMQRPEGHDVDSIERAVSRSRTAEMTQLESLLSFLATTGSTAPFIGLLGTVLGILDVFHSIGATGSASLDVLGPKIAEALFVTAIGLFVAIPAVMAYNYFVRRLRVLGSEMEGFGSDYLNIVRRHFLAPTH